MCPLRSTSRNERPCTKGRFPDYITGIYMHPWFTHHYSNDTLLSARAPFCCGTSQVWRQTFTQKRLAEPRSFPFSRRLASLCTLFRSPVLHQGNCFSSTSQEDRCDKCSRSLHRTVSGKRKGNEEWTVVHQVHNELISVPDGGEYVTGFDLSRTVTSPHGHRFPNRVRFNMNTKDGKSDIAVLSLSCRPNHNINVQISIKHKSDQQFGDGELKVARKSLSTLQTSTDSEFSVDSKWQELGGSEQAALYLQLVDENRASVALLQTHSCGDAEKEWAKQTCSKHLGEEHGTEDAHFLEDCIYDLCHGAGETQAELARHDQGQLERFFVLKLNSLRRKSPRWKKAVVVSQQMWQNTSKADWALPRSVQVTSRSSTLSHFCIFLPAMVLFSEYFNVIPWEFRGMSFNLSGALVEPVRTVHEVGSSEWRRRGLAPCVVLCELLICWRPRLGPKWCSSGAKCRHGTKMSKVMFWFLMKQMETVCKLF